MICTYTRLSHFVSQKWDPHLCWYSRFPGPSVHLSPPQTSSLEELLIGMLRFASRQCYVRWLLFLSYVPQGRSIYLISVRQIHAPYVYKMNPIFFMFLKVNPHICPRRDPYPLCSMRRTSFVSHVSQSGSMLDSATSPSRF